MLIIVFLITWLVLILKFCFVIMFDNKSR